MTAKQRRRTTQTFQIRVAHELIGSAAVKAHFQRHYPPWTAVGEAGRQTPGSARERQKPAEERHHAIHHGGMRNPRPRPKLRQPVDIQRRVGDPGLSLPLHSGRLSQRRRGGEQRWVKNSGTGAGEKGGRREKREKEMTDPK
jgi:hypothetical protein